MLKLSLITLALLGFAIACGPEEQQCGIFCYNPTQYTCDNDLYLGVPQLCAVGTTACNGACIADCGFLCNTTTGEAEPNDDDELVCPPDCSITPGYGACGDTCIDTDDFCCIGEKPVATASCPYNKPAASNTLGLNCTLQLQSVGQLWDGQLRNSFGPGAAPVTFTLVQGQLLDNRGQICYVSNGYQIQCNTPAQTTDFKGFGVTTDGYLTYNNTAILYQCPVGTGGYNIFTQPPTSRDICTPVAIPTTSDCPKPAPPVCTTAVDVAVVVDMSGSVSNTQFAAITAFTVNFANQFQFGTQSGRMGLVWFGNSAAYKTNGMISDRAAFIRAANVSRPTEAQSSCVGCGLKLANDLLKSNARSGVPQVLLLLSDGQSNVPQNTARGCWKWSGNGCVGGSAGVLPAPNWLDQVTALRANSQLTVFSLGVVADGNLQEKILTQIASPKSYYCIGAYERLVSSVNKIRDATCPASTRTTTTSAAPTRASTSSTTRASTVASTSAASTTNKPAASGPKPCPTKPVSIPHPWCYFDFDFDFSGSSTCKDKSGNNRHGTHYGLKGGFGYWRQGAKCSGKKQYISVDKVDTLPTSFSVASWINITASSDSVVVAATTQWSLRLSPKSNTCYFTKGSGRSAQTFSWNLSLNVGSYFHLAFTVDTRGQALLYKDGQTVGRTQSCGSIPKSTGQLYLAYHEDFKFEGIFDDLLLFDKCLSSTEVDSICKHNHCY